MNYDRDYDSCNDFPIRHLNSKDCCCICGKTPVVCKGLCSGHYHKLCRYGKADLPNRKEHDNRTKHPLYYMWKGIKGRCYYKNNPEYSEYGGRGIKMCERWRNTQDGFWNFVRDMGPRPEGYSIDRIDVNGDYCPENCRWATRYEQMNNTQIAQRILTEAMENGFVATYRVRIETDIGTRNFSFCNLEDLNDFIIKLTKGEQ